MGPAAEPTIAAVGWNSGLLGRVDYGLAQTLEEKQEIYNLRYRAYLREGAIPPSADERVTDQYDDLPNSWTFGVYFHGELYSSVRISVLTSDWRMSCSAEAFGEILNPRLDRGEIIIDPARFVADPDKAKRFPELPYVTVRLPWVAMEYFDAHDLLATVRTEHQAFYKRLLGHQVICPPRPYPNLQKPISLMTLDYREARERVHRRYPFFRSNYFERRMLFERNIEMQQRTAA